MKPIILIGVRKHSHRIPRKAWARVGHRALFRWTFDLAQALGWETWVSSDDRQLLAEARRRNMGWIWQIRREPPIDLDWITDWICGEPARQPDTLLVILRVTSPFRTARSVRRAVRLLGTHPEADSIRAVRPVREHPWKLWRVDGWDQPMCHVRYSKPGNDWHSRSYQELFEACPAYVQSSALEVTRVRTIRAGSLSGDVVLPFKMPDREHFTIDWPEDLIVANHMAKEHR